MLSKQGHGISGISTLHAYQMCSMYAAGAKLRNSASKHLDRWIPFMPLLH